MKITFILPKWCDHPIGGYRVVYEYSNRLVWRGHHVTIIHPIEYDPGIMLKSKFTSIFTAGVRRLSAPIRPSWFSLDNSINSLLTPTWDERYIPDSDAIFATSWRTAEWVNSYSSIKGEKFYFIQHYETWSGPEDAVKATWLLPFHRIVISKWLSRLAEDFGVKVLACIPNGTNFDMFNETSPIKGRTPYRMCMLYHAHPWKGFKYGLETVRMVKEKYPELEVNIFSTYKRRTEIPEWINYHYNPPQEMLVRLYNSCSIYISPSLTEGWGLPATESMACGCALVSTDIDGVKDYAINGETALLSPPGDPKAMAGNIITLLENNAYRIQLAENGKKFISQFTWDRAVDLLEKAIGSIVMK